MKRRILFVDDEELVLQGLQRMLRPMREEWEMSFVDSGPKALDSLSREPCDVVVSDMRMPGMNGAALLNEVMQRHPQTVRLILSGHADKDLILKCVGSTHQFLAKPCDPEALKATVHRATNLDGTLHSARVKEMVCRMDRLPSIPALYTEIVDTLNTPDATLEDVGKIIARDIGMTAKILKIVNSAFFGLRREISTPQEAAAYLGLDILKSLVLSIHAFSQYDGVMLSGLNMEGLWRHSLNTAGIAKQIAEAEEADARLIDNAFVAGMLHDVGKLVMAANLGDDYIDAVTLSTTRPLRMVAAEEEVFGANHADVGGSLLGLWGLPDAVVEAIALHHHPERGAQEKFSALTAVHVANALEPELNQAKPSGTTAVVARGYLEGIGLGDRLPTWREAVGFTDQSN